MAVTAGPLNLDAGVSEEDYVRSLEGLRDAYDEYRESQGWCTAFWDYIREAVSRVFRYDGYDEVVVLNTAAASDEARADELRKIRGRTLRHVGGHLTRYRLTLETANEMLRRGNLPGYTPSSKRSWEVSLPRFVLTVEAAEDPQVTVQGLYRDFLTQAGDPRVDEHVARVYTTPARAQGSVPAGETVPLLTGE